MGDVGMGIGRSPCCHISTFKDLAHGPSSAVKVKQYCNHLHWILGGLLLGLIATTRSGKVFMVTGMSKERVAAKTCMA